MILLNWLVNEYNLIYKDTKTQHVIIDSKKFFIYITRERYIIINIFT